MMSGSERFPYLPASSATPAPRLPVRLSHQGHALDVTGLLDTGAALSVLPHLMGIQLGLRWDEQTISLRLTGNLAMLEARAVVVLAAVGSFPPKRLAFAWTEADQIPLILGQINFFQEFDVCFFRSRLCFDVRPQGDVGV